MGDMMTFDLLAGIELTASATIVIAVVALAMAATPAQRIRLASALAVWFGAVVALGASNALYDGALGVAGLGLAAMLPVLVMTGLTFGTERGRLALADAPLPALIGVNVVRIDGVIFLLLHAAKRLPAPFASLAGWGDITVAATAPLVAWAVARNHPWSRRVAVGWNALGLLDLANAVSLAAISLPGPLRVFVAGPSSAIMSELPWLLIPGFLVPLLACCHVVLFARLAGSPRPRRHALARHEPRTVD